MKLTYKPPGPVAKAFMLSDAFVRGLRGPVGSGKSGSCIMEVFRRCCLQEKDARDGRRKSRWAIIRNTNPQLRSTTMKSWGDWLRPDSFGEPSMHPPPFTHWLTVGDLEAEVMFLALDTPADVRKLLSLELTGAFVNEAREVPKSIIDGVTMRVRRYPALKDGGATWSGLIMDTNAPDDDHWWPIMAGDSPPPEGMSAAEAALLVKPHNWEFYTQPAAMNEEKNSRGEVTGYTLNELAENVQNLDTRYYYDLIQGKTKTWIDVYVMNRLGSIDDGRAVHPEFKKSTHVASVPLVPIPKLPIMIGADFGLTPAAIFGQRLRDRWLILKEIVLEGVGADKLAAAINRVMAEDFPDHELRTLYGDPAGDERVGTDANTPFQMLRTKSIPARKCETNDPEIRRLALSTPLNRMVEGEPAVQIDPGCTVLIRGLEGGFCYKRIRTAHGEMFDDEPEKNRYSHPVEALEYLMLGAGEARDSLRQKRESKVAPHQRVRIDPLDRIRGQRRPSLGALRR